MRIFILRLGVVGVDLSADAKSIVSDDRVATGESSHLNYCDHMAIRLNREHDIRIASSVFEAYAAVINQFVGSEL